MVVPWRWQDQKERFSDKALKMRVASSYIFSIPVVPYSVFQWQRKGASTHEMTECVRPSTEKLVTCLLTAVPAASTQYSSKPLEVIYNIQRDHSFSIVRLAWQSSNG